MLLREESRFGLTAVPSVVFQRSTGAWIGSLCIAAIVIWWVLMGPDPGDRVLQEIGFALPVPNHPSKVVGKTVVMPPPPRCREGVDSPYLPTCPFRASGDSARSTPFGELCVLTYAGRG
uniref:Uncharacterized protein n=1 Tax=Candidatus Kentrum sp. TC TaxID=2126339 RepID=A0A451AB92_9GAMM|nr:MAG: hypothetical protein BECKTC1821F_GA0114240_10913 [Candidatus Kentron sp. TC]